MQKAKINTYIAFLIKVAAISIGFGLNVFLARSLGTEGLGVFVYSVSLIRLLTILANLGFGKLLIREVSTFLVKEEWSKLTLLTSWAQKTVIASSCLLVAVTFLLVGILFDNSMLDEPLYIGLSVAIFSLPLNTINSVFSAILKGYQKIQESLLPEFLIGPLIVLFSCFCVSLYKKELLTSKFVLISYIISNFFVVLISFVFYTNVTKKSMMSRKTVDQIRQSSTLTRQEKIKAKKNWKKSLIPLLMVNASQIIFVRSDIIMIGLLLGAKEAGIYSVSMYGAQFVSFVRTSANTVLEPIISSSFAQNGVSEKLQKIVMTTTRKIFLVALAFALVIFLSSPIWLNFFGAEFKLGTVALALLLGSELIHASASASWKILVASGNERLMAGSVFCCMCINVCLNAYLIPRFGISGAALATILSVLTNNIITSYFSSRIGIKANIFGI